MMTAAQMIVQMMMWLEQCHIGPLHLLRQVFSRHSHISNANDFHIEVIGKSSVCMQGIGRLFRCLCNPAYDVDDDFEPHKK
jgi:hypothetical protein